MTKRKLTFVLNGKYQKLNHSVITACFMINYFYNNFIFFLKPNCKTL